MGARAPNKKREHINNMMCACITYAAHTQNTSHYVQTTTAIHNHYPPKANQQPTLRRTTTTMILTLDQWSLGYEQILRDCRTSTPIIGTVLLLVSPATDSLCAAKIITHMLRSDEIPYTLTQCNNYHQLDYQLEHLEESIKSVICLNCGGGRSLVDKMPEDSKVFILDSHRPIHLQNIHAGRNVGELLICKNSSHCVFLLFP